MLSSFTLEAPAFGSIHSTLFTTSTIYAAPEHIHIKDDQYPVLISIRWLALILLALSFLLLVCTVKHYKASPDDAVYEQTIYDFRTWCSAKAQAGSSTFQKICEHTATIGENSWKFLRAWSVWPTIWCFFAPHLRRAKQDLETGKTCIEYTDGSKIAEPLRRPVNNDEEPEPLLGRTQRTGSRASAITYESKKTHLQGSSTGITSERASQKSHRRTQMPETIPSYTEARFLRALRSVSSQQSLPNRPAHIPVLQRVSSAPTRFTIPRGQVRDSFTSLEYTVESHLESLKAAVASLSRPSSEILNANANQPARSKTPDWFTPISMEDAQGNMGSSGDDVGQGAEPPCGPPDSDMKDDKMRPPRENEKEEGTYTQS
ncbi:hypothetical protein IQ06DRAFT_348016 [Phaeosphaeriaceae sp. SRC1lsM3a]|nr:hypothetical protein IQ06DRAFT_348016 [Stagonospora sp. SRC1lsM3a]